MNELKQDGKDISEPKPAEIPTNDHINGARSVKAAAIVSQILLLLWLILTILSYIFQQQVINRLFYGTGIGNIPKIFLFSHAAQLAAFAVVTTANIFVLKNKGRAAPLWTVSVSAAAVPVLDSVLYYWQGRIVIENDAGIDYALLSAFNHTNMELMYVLYLGAAASIAACAVHAYIKKSPKNI